MTNDVHTLMRNADNINATFCNGIEDQIPSFWKTVITEFTVCQAVDFPQATQTGLSLNGCSYLPAPNPIHEMSITRFVQDHFQLIA